MLDKTRQTLRTCEIELAACRKEKAELSAQALLERKVLSTVTFDLKSTQTLADSMREAISAAEKKLEESTSSTRPSLLTHSLQCDMTGITLRQR